jgi:hypothetical protein
MSIKKEKFKKIVNGRLLKNYGSWMYCDNCSKTIGYLCYTTYDYFRFSFTCTCDCRGSFELGEKSGSKIIVGNDLLLKGKRLCCSFDEAPLFSVVDNNLKEYSFEVVCNKCFRNYLKGE